MIAEGVSENKARFRLAFDKIKIESHLFFILALALQSSILMIQFKVN